MTATLPESSDHGSGPGLREQKKRRTRETLVDCAFRRFADQGYDTTTVEEIAADAGVSSRTFFRYFGSKEEVALTTQAEQARQLLDRLAERPADEPILTAMRTAIVALYGAYERDDPGFDRARFRLLFDMVADSDALLAASLEHAQQVVPELAAVVAHRLGSDPRTDLRSHVIASTFIGAVQTAATALRGRTLPYTTLSEALSDTFAILEQGLTSP